MTDIRKLAGTVDSAARDARAIAQLSAVSKLPLDEAYSVQKASIDLRFARGERRVGLKMGFTSRAKAIQVGVHDLIWGRLTDRMIIEDGGSIDFARYAHPRVEPEIAFLLKAPLEGVVTPAQALTAVEATAPAMELIDSRYENFNFSLEDVVADNSSSSGFVAGPWHGPNIDFSKRKCSIWAASPSPSGLGAGTWLDSTRRSPFPATPGRTATSREKPPPAGSRRRKPTLLRQKRLTASRSLSNARCAKRPRPQPNRPAQKRSEARDRSSRWWNRC